MDAVLFDFGGTLDSDAIPWIDRFYRLYAQAGLADDRARFDRIFYDADDNLPTRFSLQELSLEETVTLQVRCVLGSLAPERVAETGRIVQLFLAESRAAFQRMLPVLERLSHRYRLGVVSNFYGNLDSVLASEGLRGRFAAVIDSGAVGTVKPDPSIFQAALKALGTAPDQTLMVGDSIQRDMRGAEALGMPHLLIGDPSKPACCPRALRAASVADMEKALAPVRVGIIAAGEGSRLKSSHPGTIKPLVPINGRPLCHWIVGSLKEAGATDFTVLFNSKGRPAQNILRTAFPGLRWTFLERNTASSWESFRLVTAHLAQSGGDFLISTVDALVPPSEVRRFLHEARRIASPTALALTPFVDDEKPLWADLHDGRVTALGARARQKKHTTCGLYYLTAEAAQALPAAQAHGSLREYLTALVTAGRTAGIILAKTLDVDRPEDVRQAETFVAALGS